MRTQRFLVVGAVVTLALPPLTTPAAAQRPLGTRSATGQTVTPAFEGWYVNPDGTRSISFGYFNRNFEQVLEIPVGPNNMIEPAMFNGRQPTVFHARRHWGVFAIEVPADFDGEIVWTLKNGGTTFEIPGTVHRDWQIDALAGEAGSGNTPPVLKFDMNGPEGAGPLGVTGAPLTTSVGTPLPITVWASDDYRMSGSVASAGRESVPVTLTWFKYQGPGDVTFDEPSARIGAPGGQMTTMASFTEPGEYLLRVRANDASGVSGAGHAQCCWTNGFVTVTVTN